MYGFIEKWLADILNVDHEEFGLNDGSVAALLDKPVFEKILLALKILWREDGDPETLRPQAISSDIQGALILFHKYWANEGILNGLTDGETKNTEPMVMFASLGVNRFVPDRFETRIKNAYQSVLEGNTNGEAYTTNTGVAEEEPEPVERVDRPVGEGNIHVNVDGQTVTIDRVGPAEEEAEATVEKAVAENPTEKDPTEEEKFLKFFKEKYSILLRGSVEKASSSTGKKVIFIGAGSMKPDELLILDFCNAVNKNVLCFCGRVRMSEFTAIKRNFKFADIAKHTVFLFLYPHESTGLTLPRVSERVSRSVCFGEGVTKLHLLQANNVQNAIRDDSSMEDNERRDRLNSLENNPTLSIYAKYDAVYKDTCTNVVWGLRDRCFVFFTFYFGDNNNSAFNKCMHELSRRFERKVSLEEMREIDKEYQDSISERNKDEYVKFAISSSNSLIDTLNGQFKKKKEKYEEYMDKAMEYGKLMNRLAEQIEAFDKEKFEASQREKALSEYQETIKIPGVLSIDIDGGHVHVYTKNLYAKDDRSDKWHDIGTFHIQIGMLSNDYNQDNTVRIINTKHQIDGMNQKMQAPHVFPEGRICHGSLATGMIEAYKRRDLYQLVYQLILFLQDANTDDSAGKYINKWPEVPEEVALGELSFGEDGFQEPTEAELKFDSMLTEAIPVHN